MIDLYAYEAEHAVIGALMLDDKAIDRVTNLLPAHFYNGANRRIFTAIQALTATGKPTDQITVAESLGNSLNEIGGLSYLFELVSNVPGSANIEHYAKAVIDKAMLRSLMAASNTIAELVNGNMTTAEKLNRAQAAIMEITEKAISSEPVHVGEVLTKAVLNIEKRVTREVSGIMTGFTDLDHKLHGLKNGELIIVAGRPAMGKSTLGFQFAVDAVLQGKSALILSQEMTFEQIGDRLIASVGKVGMHGIMRGELTDDDYDQATYAIGKLQNTKLYLDEQGGLTLADVRAKSRIVKRKHGLDVLVLDYLQLMAGNGDNRNNEIEVISRGLKALAKELNIPIVVLAQLSRKCEERGDKRPILSDLRDSGAIEQDADVVMFVYRDEQYNKNTHWKGTAEILIRKNRQGQTGDVILTFRGEYSRFENFTGTIPEAPQPAKFRRGFDD